MVYRRPSYARVKKTLFVEFLDAPTTHVVLTNSNYVDPYGSGTTTAQLTAPSGKTTSDFQAGHISDDTNPVSAIDLADGKYTELEFAVEVVTGLVATGDEIEFRITDSGAAIDTYTYYPKITAGSGVTTNRRRRLLIGA